MLADDPLRSGIAPSEKVSYTLAEIDSMLGTLLPSTLASLSALELER
jgi:hypothetical protein